MPGESKKKEGKIQDKVLVTGGAGFIGSHLGRELVREGKKVIAIDNLASGDWERCSDSVVKLEADLSKLTQSELVDIFSECSEVYHLAAVKLHNQKNSSAEILANNIVATDRIFEACGIAGVSRVFFSSSLYAYGSMGPRVMNENDSCSPQTYYGLSKLWGEYCLKIYSLKYGFKYAIGRLFFIYGPNQFAEGGYKSVIRKNLERLRSGQSFLIAGDGKQELDYLHVSDCVRLIYGIMAQAQNNIVNFSTGRGVSIKEIAEISISLNGGGSIEYIPQDWTHGSKRIGDNTELRKLFPDFSFVSMKSGIESVLNEEY